ncbi:GH32 C-terminal domain-containing protein [Microbacterium sp.]
MNDPNGLVHHDGRYHLFFQYNPDGVDHAKMSWGHASSTDLVQWEEHPVALLWQDGAQIFSGSAVVDHANTSGFGTAENPALAAIYTSAAPGLQNQALAYSVDGGTTWTTYGGNPVLDRGSADFRDPKVFRYRGAAGEYWVMVAVEAVERRVVIYRSDNLKLWTHLSDYGPRGAVEGVWECPDLFPLAVDGDPSDVRWVMLISLNEGAPGGGSGTQYVVGSFDGVTFTPDDDGEDAAVLWLDYGRDDYAGVTFSGLPEQERTLIAWMSNWDYAKDLPYREDEPRRGAMTLARRLSLTMVESRPRLRQQPVGPAVHNVAEASGIRVGDWTALPVALPPCARIDLAIDLADATGVELRLGHDEERSGGIRLAYDPRSGVLTHDRTHVAECFPEAFRTVQALPTRCGSRLELTAWIDVCSLEVFADDGVSVLTDLTDVATGGGVSVRSVGGPVLIERIVVASPQD